MNRAGYILTGVAASCEASHTTPRNLILGLKSDRSKLVVASGEASACLLWRGSSPALQTAERANESAFCSIRWLNLDQPYPEILFTILIWEKWPLQIR